MTSCAGNLSTHFMMMPAALFLLLSLPIAGRLLSEVVTIVSSTQANLDAGFEVEFLRSHERSSRSSVIPGEADGRSREPSVLSDFDVPQAEQASLEPRLPDVTTPERLAPACSSRCRLCYRTFPGIGNEHRNLVLSVPDESKIPDQNPERSANAPIGETKNSNL